MFRDFRIVKADSWNNGAGGAPYLWLVYLDDRKIPYYGETLESALAFVKERAEQTSN